MDAFVWDQRFVTGLATVDLQHRHLVDLVNQVGDFLLENSGDEAALEAVFGELATYALEHFAEEEKLMADLHVDARHVQAHTQHHRDFVTQLVSMWERRGQSSDPAGMLHGYLASWLTVHILGEDQVMANMMDSIRQGLAPAAAFEKEAVARDNNVSALLDALYKLYHVLSVQNRELAGSNQALEEKVEKRTHDLAELNQQLQREQEDLKRALAHVEATQQQLLNAEKMASLGRMVAGFAHEVNTPVGIAVGAASQSRELVTEFGRLLDQEEVTEEDLRSRLHMLDEIADLTLSNLRRAADMVQSFKRTAVDQVSERERDYDLAEIIEDVQRSLHNAFKTTPIKFSVTCPTGLALYGPAGTLVQLLANLMQNSRMHGFADGTKAGTITIDARVDGERVLIDYADDGAGMSAEILEHAFEPFYTTRRGTGGSGLGLYIAYNLVTQGLGGKISCQSSPGQGCRFAIEYPRRTHSSEVAES